MKTKAELLAEKAKLRKESEDLLALMEKEDRGFTDEERNRVAEIEKAAKQINDDIKAIEKDESMVSFIKNLGQDLEHESHSAPHSSAKGKKQTMGQRFVEDPLWKTWLKSVAPNGLIPDSAKGLRSPAVDIKDFGLFRKDLITGADDTSAGAFVTPDYTNIYESLGRWPLTLRDLISIRQTTSDQVYFVRQTAQITQATTVAEANVTDYTGASGQVSGEKPEAAMTFERVTEMVKTIAAWIPTTKRALADAAQLRGLIDQELREDLNEELEDQLLNGDGIGENFTGLANTANVLVQVWNTNGLITTRQAITNLKVNGRQNPTAFLFHPNDWETIDLLRDTTGQFLRGNPFGAGPNTLWGVPVVESYLLTPGTAWLGNWRKMVLWDREQATISISDSHEDFFIRNMVAILAELRAAMAVIRPTAFVEIDLTSGS